MGRTEPYVTHDAEVREDAPESVPASRVLAHCSISERRVVLASLCEACDRSLSDLAGGVVAYRQDVTRDALPKAARDDAIIGLYHNHLQQLAGAALVDLDEAGEGVTASLASGVTSERVRELIDAGEGQWEALGVLLGDPRRERVVSLLAAADDEAVTLEDLASAIAALERAASGSPPESSVESTRVSLHHVHLPKLETGGIVTYDADGDIVELERIPEAYEAVLTPSIEDTAP